MSGLTDKDNLNREGDDQKTRGFAGYIFPRHIELTDLICGVLGTILIAVGSVYEGFHDWMFSGFVFLVVGVLLHYRHKTRQRRTINYRWLVPLALVAFGLLAYPVYALLHMNRAPTPMAGQSSGVSEPFHVSWGAGYTHPQIFMHGVLGLSPFLVFYDRQPHRQDASRLVISSVEVVALLRVENLQSVDTMILGYTLEAGDKSDNGPWVMLCPVSMVDGRLVHMTTPDAVLDGEQADVANVDLGSFVGQDSLIGHAIPPHGVISGWTMWGCPIVNCAVGDRFRVGIREASGAVTKYVIPRHAPREEVNLGLPYPAFIQDMNMDFGKVNVVLWNQCRDAFPGS